MATESDEPSTTPAVRISCQLGKVGSRSPLVFIDDKGAHRNSNRWVFDVEHDTKRTPSFECELIDFGTGKPKHGVHLSQKLQPLTREAARALLRTPDPNTVRIEADDVGVIHYRVTVDATIYTTS